MLIYLPGTTVRLLNDAYIEFCEAAIEEFADLYTPCSFEHPRLGRCYNRKSGHNPKGHQNVDGKFIGSGGYQSEFDAREFMPKWIERIRSYLQYLQSKSAELSLTLREQTENQIAAELHKQHLNDFYHQLGNVSKYVSHSTCFSCLRELPEHALPCGHVLCDPCIRAYGVRASRTAIELKRCPLHLREWLWEPPWMVAVKPPYAGVRILCLDG